jgi:hypothetical protein
VPDACELAANLAFHFVSLATIRKFVADSNAAWRNARFFCAPLAAKAAELTATRALTMHVGQHLRAH